MVFRQMRLMGGLIHRVGEPYYSYHLFEYAGANDPKTGNEDVL